MFCRPPCSDTSLGNAKRGQLGARRAVSSCPRTKRDRHIVPMEFSSHAVEAPLPIEWAGSGVARSEKTNALCLWTNRRRHRDRDIERETERETETKTETQIRKKTLKKQGQHETRGKQENGKSLIPRRIQKPLRVYSCLGSKPMPLYTSGVRPSKHHLCTY